MSLALARKYRPKRFSDVAVQSHVTATLQGAIASGRVAHGYLLCGPRGVGKTTLARVLAMALNCETPSTRQSGEPCGECPSCTRIWSGAASLDVVEIDAASNRGVDDARELRERAMYAPSGEDRYKVYIVDEAHMLTREAWNALLKILEEPPPRVIFVFATTEPQRIAQAAAPVLSRLQRFDFRRISPAEVRQRLTAVLTAENVPADPEALGIIARAADGSMRDALSLTDQVLSVGNGTLSAAGVREALGLVPEDEFISLLDILAERRAADVFPFVGRLAEAGIDFGGFLTGFADMVRAQLAVALGGSAPELSDSARQALEQRRERLAPTDLLRMLSALTELEPRFRKSGQQQLLVETLLVRLALLDRSVALEEVLRGLPAGGPGGGGGGGTGGSTGARPPAREAAAAPQAPVRAEVRQEGRPKVPSFERGAPAPARAANPVPAVESVPPSLDSVASCWEALVEVFRQRGATLLASALAGSQPVAVSEAGELAIRIGEPNEFFDRAIENGRKDVAAALRERVPGILRVRLDREAGNAAVAPPRRLTDEMLRADRVAGLRKRDPLLGAAIDALDLDLVE